MKLTPEDEDDCLNMVNGIAEILNGGKLPLAVCAMTWTIKRLCQQDEVTPEVAAWVLEQLDVCKEEILENMLIKGEG